MVTSDRIELLTLDEYSRLYDREGAFEIIDGERRLLTPKVAGHGICVQALFLMLYNLCTAHQWGEVLQEMPYVLTRDSKWVKGSPVPDVMVFSLARWQQYTAETEDWLRKPFILVPDMVAEVVSPTDSYTDIQEKVSLYLRDGVRLIWVVDPLRKRITTYEGAQYVILGTADTLTGGALLPGLSIALGDWFEQVAG